MVNNPRYTELSKRFQDGRLLSYRHREIILRAGEVPKGVYFIEQGFVKVYSIKDNGTENMHVIYKAGEIFPLIWVFNSWLRNVFYESIGSSRLRLMAKEHFLKKMHSSPDMHSKIVEQFADQFRIYADRIDNLEYTDAMAKVTYRLLTLARRFGKKVGSKVIIDAPITHQHIAESINLARETVSREIEKLERKGLVSIKKRQIILNNLKALEKIVGDYR